MDPTLIQYFVKTLFSLASTFPSHRRFNAVLFFHLQREHCPWRWERLIHREIYSPLSWRTGLASYSSWDSSAHPGRRCTHHQLALHPQQMLGFSLISLGKKRPTLSRATSLHVGKVDAQRKV